MFKQTFYHFIKTLGWGQQNRFQHFAVNQMNCLKKGQYHDWI